VTVTDADSALLFADTSAVVGAYVPDEPDHAALHTLLVDGSEPVVASALLSVELASASAAAQRRQRLSAQNAEAVRARFRHDTGPDGWLALLTFDAAAVFPAARRLLDRYPLRTLDALHLAVAEQDGRELAGDDDVVFVSRDQRQRDAAASLGFALA
jgi:predicted nucleic acid-binding protein